MAETFSYSYSVFYLPGLPISSVIKNLPANTADRRCGFDAWVRRILWRRAWNPLQCSCLNNPIDRGAWWATVHGVTKSWTQLSDWACTLHITYEQVVLDVLTQWVMLGSMGSTLNQQAACFQDCKMPHLNQVTIIQMNISKTGQVFKLTGSVTSLWIQINILILQVKNSVGRHRRSVNRTYFSTTWSRQPCPFYDPFDKKNKSKPAAFQTMFHPITLLNFTANWTKTSILR